MDIQFNIIKKHDIRDTPFEFIIYKFLKSNNYIVERPNMGKSIHVSGYDIKSLLKISGENIDWVKLPTGSIISIQNSEVHEFTSLFEEEYRKAYLSFIIEPNFSVNNTNYVSCEDKYFEISEIINRYNDNYLEKNENFQISIQQINKSFKIDLTCLIPIFKLYSIFTTSNLYDSKSKLCVMKYKNNYFRFPYGNSSTSDQMCLGQRVESEFNIIDGFYSSLIINSFNNHSTPHLNFSNKAKSTLDYELIKKNIDDNKFDNTFLDSLYYLSKTEVEEINMNIFIKSPNIPKRILEYEIEGRT